MNKGCAIGTVTDRDITVRVVAKGTDPRSAKLGDFGGNQVACVQTQDDVSRARDLLMKQHQVQRILVCDQQKKPVGVISLQDLAEESDKGEVGDTVQKVKQEGAPQSVH